MRQLLGTLGYHAAAAAGGAARALGVGRCDVAVLIYHSISEGGGVATVPPERFRKQVRWLRDHFEIVSLDAALERPVGTPPAVVLTFDDGYEDYLTAAVPFLLDQGVPSTVYVITSLLAGCGRSFPFASGRGLRSLSGRQVRQLAREELVTVGAHGHRHRRLVGQPESVLEEEFGACRAALGELLGCSDFHFAFPWGVADRRALDATRRHFRSAALAGSRGNRLPLDPFHLARIPIKREAPGLFARRVRGDLMLEGVARSLRDRLLRGGAGVLS